MDFNFLIFSLIFFLIVGIISTVLSIPAFYVLYKKNKIYFLDYGITIYALILFSFLSSYGDSKGGFGVSNYFTEAFFIILVGLIINYTKIFLPKKWSLKLISIISIFFILIATVSIFLFFPPLQD